MSNNALRSLHLGEQRCRKTKRMGKSSSGLSRLSDAWKSTQVLSPILADGIMRFKGTATSE
jgi:hypothetical protein